MSTESIWRATTGEAAWPPLAGDTTADCVVVGAGITGVTTAWLLASAGRSVVLLEAGRVGAGDTGGSTGNLYQTVSSGLHEVAAKWDDDTARAVVRARGSAVDFIALQAQRLGAAARFRRCDAFFYAGSPDADESVRKEHETCSRAGLPARLDADRLPPGPVAAAGPVLVIPGQAQFHPLGYVLALAREAASLGVAIHEGSPALEVDGDAGRVCTAQGTVQAKQVVLATHSPLGIHRMQAAMPARREYGVAFRVEHAFPPGIFWAQGRERLSMRGLDTDDGHYLICIGQQGKTGDHDEAHAMAELERIAGERLGLRGPAHRWSAQHFHSPDHLPFIGRDGSGCHVATGFQTDGLTWGTLAARIIADDVLGRQNPWQEMLRADRLDIAKSAGGAWETSVHAAKAVGHDLLTTPRRSPYDLRPGEGGIVAVDGDDVAAFRAPGGTLHALSPVCTHMKCRVRWNALETSWDCPCHGSRFAADGRVIEGPALQPLRRIELKDEPAR